jgi:hypothetical protein
MVKQIKKRMMPLLVNTKNNRTSSKFSAFYTYTLLCLLSISQHALSNSDLERSLNQAQKMISEGQINQALIDKTITETSTLGAEFKRLSLSLEQINTNLRHQQLLHEQQKLQVSSLTTQLDGVSHTEDGIVPLMLNMIDWLDKYLVADLPFHVNERRRRIDTLKDNILSPNLALAEIYRAVLDAYQVENEFSYNIESYHQSIALNGQAIESQILRIGRVGLYYLTLDGLQGGFWDRQTKQWQAANNAALNEIRQGILIAKKQLPHNLLALPLSVRGQ